MNCDLHDVIHTDHSDIVTFADDSTSYYADHNSAEVKRVTNKNLAAIEV